jgi:hypothetical protein
MTGSRTAGETAARVTGRGRRRLRSGLLAIAVLAVIALAPGQASASSPSVTPLLDCVQQNRDGSYTAVLGYSSSYPGTTSIPRGSRNHLTPARYDGQQPTSYSAGTHHGVFAVSVSQQDAFHASPTWHLDGHLLRADLDTRVSASCPVPTQLPAEGNGTGAAIALVLAGVVAALVLVRARRRLVLAGRNR